MPSAATASGPRAAASPHLRRPARSPARHFAIGLARAAGGAIIFGLPLLMTMEMWQLGFAMGRGRLALLVAATVPLLVGLSHVSGFEETFDAKEDVVDAFVAYAVGFAMSTVVLALLGVLGPGVAVGEAIGKVVLQAVPASIGALLAQSQFGSAGDEEREAGPADAGSAGATGGRGRPRRTSGYFGELFLMAAGALFLAFNVAPTEEVALISYVMSPWHVLGLAALSIGVMHAFVYAVEFSGQHPVEADTPFHHVFVRFTVVGYAVALLICAYVLWTFGRLDDTAWSERVAMVLVLGFPAAVGAAAARLIL